MKLTELEFYFEDFLLYCQSKNLSEKTLSSYEQSTRLFLIYLKNEFKVEDPDKVKAAYIRKYVQYLQERGKCAVVGKERTKKINQPENRTDYKKKISNVTINNYLRNIRVFFNYLEREGELRRNPVENLEMIKTERRKKVGISEEEFKNLIDQFDYTTFHGNRNKIITMLLQDTGMRIGECLAIGVDCIDFKHRMILLTKTKGRQERYVYFSQRMSRALRHYLKFKDRYTSTSLLFSTRSGIEVTVHLFEKQLRDAGERIGLAVYPHQLRNNLLDTSFYVKRRSASYCRVSCISCGRRPKRK